MTSSTPPESPTSSSAIHYFTVPQWAVLILIILTGLLLRWIGLDVRPLHHDESLHAMYGKYYYDFPAANYYRYDPMLHGPFLYSVLVPIYVSLGVSTWAARFPAALIGSLLMSLPFLLRRYLSPAAVIGLTAAIACSPTLVYWARFIREDSFVLLGMACCLYGLFGAGERHKALFFWIGVAIQFCSKENSYVHVAMVIGYVLFEFLYTSVVQREGRSLLSPVMEWVEKNPVPCVLGILSGALVFAAFYTAFGQHPEGLLDGLYRKSVKYWWEHHSMERIVGPFLFHVYVLGWYETLFVLAVLIQSWILYRRAPWVLQLAAAAIFFGAVSLALSFRSDPKLPEYTLWRFFKLKDYLDIIGLFVLVSHSVLLTVIHLHRRERVLAAAGYWFTASLFSYSYLGEKVPWLSIYPLVSGLLYLTLFFDRHFREHPITDWRGYRPGDALYWIGTTLIVLGIIFMLEDGEAWNWAWIAAGGTLSLFALLDTQWGVFERINLRTAVFAIFVLYNVRAAILTNFVYAGEASEFISQVHTTYQMQQVAFDIRREIETSSRGYKPRVYVEGEGVWPLTWYFRDLPEYRFDSTAPEFERKNFKYHIINWDENAKPPPGYRARRIDLRGWWVPDYQHMTLKHFLGYAWHHRPWSSPGFAYATLLTRIDEEPGAL
jgi:uncharacterized protein (TIGR03663 family)